MPLRFSVHGLLLGLIFGLLAGCSQDAGETGVQGKKITLAEIGAKLNLAWYLSVAPSAVTASGDTHVYTFDPKGPARCYTGSPYHVSVRKGTSPNVMLYLQGGGACWNEETCFTHPISRNLSEPLSASHEEEGVFSRAAANPFRDWNVVYAAYCDASLWMGDADATYGSQIAFHHGMANAAAAVALLQREFPTPQKLVVTGSSAGGYGTLMGYVIGRSVFPQTKMYVVNDSGPWLLNPENGAMTREIVAHWNAWNAAAFHAPACPDCQVDLYRIADWAMGQDTETRWGLFSYEQDIVIAKLYMKYGDRFPEVLRDMNAFLARRHPDQYRSYIAKGFSHTSLGTDAMYGVSRDGAKLTEWVAAMVNDDENWGSVPQ